MNTLTLKHRLKVVSAALSSLIMASGCHYYGNLGSAAGYSDYDSISSPPFYRMFPQAQPYDGNPQSPAPQQMPPSVLPMPGYSEPSNEVPPAPTPTTKRSKWNLFSAGIQFPRFRRNNESHQQSATRDTNQDLSVRTGKARSAPELPELSSTATGINQPEVAVNDADQRITSVRSVLKQDDVELYQVPTATQSLRKRSAADHNWPAPKVNQRKQSVETEAVDGQSSAPTWTSPAVEPPMLLPPPL